MHTAPRSPSRGHVVLLLQRESGTALVAPQWARQLANRNQSLRSEFNEN
eukprot:CAMPEP_0204310170 /NCGR_PEP_ID=MMETSP0469-20131031/1541_1 /ASSEMBLY_ACC=CAM_ASM_000384 /TAXON_ID=2969 /ORGANISM="Oxyrrhis marina" /LENGTH=48 /DNA_ID= /DNA_START= /DNA_END= /DNA_ORIENTATION=